MSFIIIICQIFFYLKILSCKNVNYLTQSTELEINPNGENLEIYCYNSSKKPSLNTIWLSVTINLKGINSKSKIFIEDSDENVRIAYDKSQVYLVNPINYILGRIVGSRSKYSLNPFNSSCLGVVSLENYAVNLSIKAIDPWLLLFFVMGIILFFSADTFSKSILFYYGSGIFIGIFGSVIIIAFILSRYFPSNKGILLSLITTGVSINAYIWEYLRTNLLFYLQEYFHIIVLYILCTGLISFGICYIKGPISNPRLIDIIRWFIRLIAIVFIYFGCNFYQISIGVAFILCISTFLNIAYIIKSTMLRFFMIRFPKKRRLLTEEEYTEQASIETRKALEELRSFCRSPQCDAWNISSRLSSPKRFAQWVEGDVDHVTEDEIYQYDTSKSPTIIPSLCYDD